jgi:hypothetical protein
MERKLPCGPSPEKNPKKESDEVYHNLVKVDLGNIKTRIKSITRIKANNHGSTMKSIDSGPSLLRPDPWSPTSMSMSRSTSIQSQARPPPRARPALWPTTLVEDLYWLAGREAV